MFSFFQSLLTWRHLGAEPLTPRCRQKRSTTFVRSEWRKSWSEHARVHVRKRLCKRRTTQETLCLFYRKYTGSYQILIYTVKQHSNAMSLRVALFLFGFLCFFNSTSRNVEQKIKLVFAPQNSDDLVFSFLSANGVSRGWEKHTAVTVIQKERRLLHWVNVRLYL